MNKILFFDVKTPDRAFLEQNKIDNCEFILNKEPVDESALKSGNFEEFKEIELISVTVVSRVTEKVIDYFPNLKAIFTRSMGYSHIDIEHCKLKGVKVFNTPNYGDFTVAEFGFGLLLDAIRKINIAYYDLKNGTVNLNNYVGAELYEKTIGIVGLGGIGSRVAKIANGFSMKILGFDIYQNPELVEKYGVEYVSIDELCEKSDIISLHIPSTKESYHLLDERRFNLMKTGVVIVNTARGEIIDTKALYDALISKKVSACGLDVLECEEIICSSDYMTRLDCIDDACLLNTLINHKLLALPNVTVTPHIAYDTKEAVDRLLSVNAENIGAFLAAPDTLKNEVSLK